MIIQQTTISEVRLIYRGKFKLQILIISHFDKAPITELLTNYDYKDIKELNCIQVKINYIYGETNVIIYIFNQR
jgi:hypothetical protein